MKGAALARPPAAPIRSPVPAWLQALLLAALGLALGWAWPGAALWPEPWVLPLADWITAALRWLARDLEVGGVTLRDVTRGIAAGLAWPLAVVEGLLFEGFRDAGLPPLPWPLVVGGVAVLGHRLGGARLAWLGGLSMAYLAAFGLWEDAMRTLSLVLVTVPLAAGAGLALGVWMFRHPRGQAVAGGLLDLMQATPHMAYLAPVAVFFGFGPVPAMIASAIFALPPMARCVLLGLRGVPAETVEAATMAGCRPRQLLWRVRLPVALPALLVGLNQVVMQTLAMAVIASLVGATGLGHRLLLSLQQLQLGRALEAGVAIVLIAVVLDRLTRAWAGLAAGRVASSFSRRPGHLAAFGAVALASVALAAALPAARVLPDGMTVTTAPLWDRGVRWVSVTFAAPLSGFRDAATIYLLVPLRTAFASLPWVVVALLVGWGSWRLRGARFALVNLLLVLLVVLVGLWTPAMLTLYLTTLAVLVCMGLGVPLGVAAAHRPRLGRAVLAACDTLQTFPSFIYLIPVIMLFRVGDLASLIAIVGYAAVPAIRFTHLGITGIPPAVIEAAVAGGTTPRQRLWLVELPLAVPAILLGLTQTILMALAMTAITALIGSRDLGQEILKALPEVDTGRGLLAGLAIAAIGLVSGRMIEARADRIKARLGMAGR